MSTSSPIAAGPKLSVVVIVGDAEDLIAATLVSAQAIADELIVINTNSQGRTTELARGAGARVVTRPWTDSFADARNCGMDEATGNWILWLDAGETITPLVGQQLRARIATAPSDTAFLLMVEIPPEPGHPSGEQAACLRLVPNHKSLRFTGRVRESLLPAIAAAGMRLETLGSKIYRRAHDRDPLVKASRARRNMRLAELQIAEDGEQLDMSLAIGESLATLGRHEDAARHFRRALTLAERGSTEMLEAYYGLLASLEGPSQRDAQIGACLEALEVYPLDAQLLCGMGSYMVSQGRPDLALRSFTIAIEHGHIDPRTWHLADIIEVSESSRGLVFQRMGSDVESRQSLELALERFPQSERLRRHLIQLHIKHGRAEEAVAQCDLLPDSVPHREQLRTAILGALLATQRNWLAALPYLKSAYADGCRDLICLRWLAVSALSVGEIAYARPVLAEWQALEPTNTEVTSYLEAISQQPQPTVEEPSTAPAQPQPMRPSRIADDDPARRLRVDTSPHPHVPDRAPNMPAPRIGGLPERFDPSAPV